jgi:hypothetical protein
MDRVEDVAQRPLDLRVGGVNVKRDRVREILPEQERENAENHGAGGDDWAQESHVQKSGEARSEEKSAQGRSVTQREAAQGALSDMNGDQIGEKFGTVGESSQEPVLQAGKAIEQQQQSCHALWEAEGLSVASFVSFQIAGGQRVCEQKRLAESHGQTFTGDGVGGS